ncbi:MAG: T9SS type A sorting domain-containing protein, partial [Bacteroidota bacterium]|nr:T9SS type A sorting domain-containing protein [Bacteroidota bacterium]
PSLTLCPGMSTTLTANSSAGNYTWSPGGQNTSAITVTPAISTVYNVASTHSVGGCVTNTNVTVFVVVCTGIAKSTVIDNNTFIYPNPNSGNINVVIENSNGSYAFEVHDLAGRVVYKTTLNKSESAVSIKELANGMYTYKITSLTSKIAIKEGKLIKE